MPTASAPAKDRIPEILKRLEKAYPDARCELDYDGPFQLLIATILAAQCTDVRVNMVTPRLFKKYPTPQAFASASLSELEEAIHSTGFYRAKAKNIQRCCAQIVAECGGEVPQTIEELTRLAGIGRKSANVVLGNCFDVPGVIVDTHVLRLSKRLGFSRHEQAEKVERDLMGLVPKKSWTRFSTLLTIHGRYCCVARKPKCSTCPIAPLCPSAGKVGV